MSKVLAAPANGPSQVPNTNVKAKPSSTPVKLALERAEIGRSLELTGQPVLPKWSASGSLKRPPPKKIM